MNIEELKTMTPAERVEQLRAGGASATSGTFADGNSKVGDVKVMTLFTPLAGGFRCGPYQDSERDAIAVAQEFLETWDGVLPDEH